MLDENRYTTYINKDGRTRVYDKVTHKVTSYPRLLMANKLGRPLKADEDVHHIDGNKENNSLDNLTVVKHGEHQREHNIEKINEGIWKNHTSFTDKIMICPICGNEFLWTAERQYARYQNNLRKNRKTYMSNPFCSPRCCGIRNQQEQMLRKAQAECALIR